MGIWECGYLVIQSFVNGCEISWVLDGVGLNAAVWIADGICDIGYVIC